MKELYTALLEAKKNITPPYKNKSAVYGNYADLESVLDAVEAPLAEQGLLIVHTGVWKDGQALLRTSIVHAETGQSIDSDIPLVVQKANDPQKLGGSITYARRYGIISGLSIVTDDDDDGNTSAGKTKTGREIVEPKGVTQEQIEETFPGQPADEVLPNAMIGALEKQLSRAGIKDGVAEASALLNRKVSSLEDLTEAEARTLSGHARKVKRGDSEALA